MHGFWDRHGLWILLLAALALVAAVESSSPPASPQDFLYPLL